MALTWSTAATQAAYDATLETQNTFLGMFPTFCTADWLLGAATLARYEGLVGDGWGAQRDLIVGLETANALALSPAGRAAKMVSKDGTSTYGQQLKTLMRAHACAFHRIG